MIWRLTKCLITITLKRNQDLVNWKSFLLTKQKSYPPIGDIMIISLGISIAVLGNGTWVIYPAIGAISVSFANFTLDLFKYKNHIDISDKSLREDK